MDSNSNPKSDLTTLSPIRVETALSRYPVHRLARKGSIDIEIKEQNAEGETTTRWEVDYSKKHGQPGPTAYKVDTLIVNRRIEEAARPIPKMIRLGGLREICRELNLSEGENVNSLRKALRQNAFAGITAKTTYRLADGTIKTLEADFTRYSVVFTGEELPDGRKADAVYIVLNEIYMMIINGAMTRPLDYEYLKELAPGPQRFYELLSYKMFAAFKWGRPSAKMLYSEFCAHAPQTRHSDWEQVRSQMNKLHRPHRESGYIAGFNSHQTTDPLGKPDWILHYQPGPKAEAEYRAFTKRGGPAMLEIEPAEKPSQASAEMLELERELLQRGVNPTAARELVQDYNLEDIRLQIEYVQFLSEKKPDKIDDPPAYLVGAIKGNYAAPKGFVSAEERRRRDEAKREKERLAAETRRREREEAEADRNHWQRVQEHLKGLTNGEIADLEAKALAAAGQKTQADYASPIMAKHRDALMATMIREYLRPILSQRLLENA